MGLHIAVWYEPEEVPTISRRQLAKEMKVHFNTLRKDELLIKQWIPDAAKYYRDVASNKLEGVPLNPYLIWLLYKIRMLRKSKAVADTEIYVFQNPQEFTSKEFVNYVEANARKVRSIEAA